MRLELPAADTRWRRDPERLADGRLSIRRDDDGIVLYWPYVPLPAGRYRATVEFDGPVGPDGAVLVEVMHGQGARRLGSAVGPSARIDAAGGALRLDFECPEAVEDLEIRLVASGGFEG